MNRFLEIPKYPERVSGTSILVRLLDGLGFRFLWSTEGLEDEDYGFRPSHDSRSIDELIRHIWGLINWVCISVLTDRFEKQRDIRNVRSSIIEMISVLRDSMISMTDEDLAEVHIEKRPFWHIINGPVSDALTHVGQINSFRRLAGNPTPKARVFLGLPPEE